MTDIAWSPIVYADDDNNLHTIKVGEEVSASDIGVDDDEFESMKAAGAVRSRPYPDDVGLYESPRERNIRKIKEVMTEAEESAYADMPILDEPTHLSGEVSTQEVQVNKDEGTEERKSRFSN